MTLSRFVEGHDYFSPLDRQFARFMARLAGDGEALYLAAALVSAAVGRGNVCLDLQAAGGQPIVPGSDGGEGPLCPSADEWVAALRGLPVVAEPGERKPLVLDGAGRLYLYRYWKYERDLADALSAMAASALGDVDAARLREGLGRLFLSVMGELDRQRLAAATAILRRLTIISGGPGTGKTSTVVKVLALLLEQHEGLRIALAAPTGKAAARLKESVASARDRLPVEEGVRERIPDQVFTLHRLLGIGEGGGPCRFDGENPLPYDVVVVDEASMVDLPLMAKLLAAVPSRCRLILLGDKDQLASVEAGAVLGDICGDGDFSLSNDFRAKLSEATGEQPEIPGGGAGGIADSIVVLERSYRFSSSGGIGELARCINRGDGDGSAGLLSEAREGISLGEADDAGLRQAILDGYAPYLKSSDPEEALRLFNDFRILSPLRRGRYGVEEMNRLAEKLLSRERLIDPSSRWYAGRPVMVTRNDYTLRLFNGDVGIVLPDAAAEGALRAWFPGSEGGVRRFIPQSLPAHETVYAMTVHKSQGSEFRRVLLLLPESRGEFLTRELVYTAVTRAVEHVEIRGSIETLREAAGRRVRRASGLSELLWRRKQFRPSPV